MNFENFELVDRVYNTENKKFTPLETHRRSHVKRRYGISYDVCKELFTKQNGKCAICNEKKEDINMNGLHIDHNHKTGKIRELLCRRCNIVLGHIENNLDLLKSMLDYIEKHK